MVSETEQLTNELTFEQLRKNSIDWLDVYDRALLIPNFQGFDSEQDYVLAQVEHENILSNKIQGDYSVDLENAISLLEKKGDIFGCDKSFYNVKLPEKNYVCDRYLEKFWNNTGEDVAKEFMGLDKKPYKILIKTIDALEQFNGKDRSNSLLFFDLYNSISRNLTDERYLLTAINFAFEPEIVNFNASVTFGYNLKK